MGVLVFLLFFLWPFCAHAAPAQNTPVEIIFDSGNPDASVGIVGENLLEVGHVYERYQIVAFESAAIIVKESESEDHLKWFKEGNVSSAAYTRARRLFIVKQMKAIHEAQTQYLTKFAEGYAPDLNSLIDHELLPDGFQEMAKQNYTFRILKVGEAKQLAIQFKREPTYLAVAEPIDTEADPFFFSVDQLGLVRYANSVQAVTWGPVWDYTTLNEDRSGAVLLYKGEE